MCPAATERRFAHDDLLSRHLQYSGLTRQGQEGVQNGKNNLGQTPQQIPSTLPRGASLVQLYPRGRHASLVYRLPWVITASQARPSKGKGIKEGQEKDGILSFCGKDVMSSLNTTNSSSGWSSGT